MPPVLQIYSRQLGPWNSNRPRAPGQNIPLVTKPLLPRIGQVDLGHWTVWISNSGIYLLQSLLLTVRHHTRTLNSRYQDPNLGQGSMVFILLDIVATICYLQSEYLVWISHIESTEQLRTCQSYVFSFAGESLPMEVWILECNQLRYVLQVLNASCITSSCVFLLFHESW